MEFHAVCHVHSKWSYDGSWTLEALAAKFAARGSRILMMTEHDRGFTASRLDQYREACGRASSDKILVVPGIEYSDAANRVHVLVWGSVPFLGERLQTGEMLDGVRAAGGLAVLAHPSRREAWKAFDASWADRLLGIESWNRKYDGWAPSKTAPELIDRAGTIPFVGLDFHTDRQTFPLMMAMDLQVEDPITEETVLACLRARRCSPQAFGLPLNEGFIRTALPALELPSAVGGSWPRSLKIHDMRTNAHHISVCICTFKRAEFLKRLLDRLSNQRTEGLFTYSAVVSDNDSAESAKDVVTAFSTTSTLQVSYCSEPQQNIALARNKALQYAQGDFAAFIDDDEFPADDWLLNLFKACATYGADGVLGPVKPHFESEPPRWLTKGKFFDRPTHPSGYKLSWAEARTGNVLFKKDILNKLDVPFRSQFATAGEDMDFFRRLMDEGCLFVWCDEAVAYETVPSSRCKRSYLLRRAMLRGSNFPKHPADRVKNVAKSLIAVPCYTLALPILALFGEHVFLKYLIKLLDHVSRLLAFLGLRLAVQREA